MENNQIEKQVIKFTKPQRKIINEWQSRMYKYNHKVWLVNDLLSTVYSSLNTRQKNILYKDTSDYVVERLLGSILINCYGYNKETMKAKINASFHAGISELYETDKITKLLILITFIEEQLYNEDLPNYLDKVQSKINNKILGALYNEN